MATLALLTLPLAGHFNPMMAGARALKAAGHRPVVIGPPDVIDRVPADISTWVIGSTDWPRGSLADRCACLSRMRSVTDFRRMLQLVADHSQFYLDHLPDAIEAINADGIIHDQLEPAVGIVARGLKMRSSSLAHISLACALPMNREALILPPLLGWSYRASAFGAWLNQGYYRVVDTLLAEQGRVLADGAGRFGLKKCGNLESWQEAWSVEDGLSRSCDLAQGFASLDYPRHGPPLYLGPLRSSQSPYPGLEAIAAHRDGRPLCFISLGTLMGGRTSLLLAMARAADRRGLQPLVVHGGKMDKAAQRDFLQRAPTGTLLHSFLNQTAVMRACHVAILHGGYNSTTDAIAAGLPVVIVPLAFEQGAIAARVERANLGRAVSRFGPNMSRRIRLALGDVLSSEAVRLATRQTRFEALAAPGLPGLVECVEATVTGHSSVKRLALANKEAGIVASKAPLSV